MVLVSNEQHIFDGYIPPPGSVTIFPTWVKGGSSTEVRDWRGAFIDSTGSTTAGLAEAIAALDELGVGGTVFLPSGTYELTDTLTITSSDIEIVGAGTSTVIKNTATVTPGVLKFDGVSRIAVRNMKFELSAASVADSAMRIESGTSGETTDITLDGLHITQAANNNSGIVFANNGATWRRINIQNCYIDYTGATPTAGIGLNLSAGDTSDCEQVKVSNVWIDGFQDAFASNTATGFWHDCQLVNCTFTNADRYGGWFRHMGEIQVSNCHFEGNGAGALFDNGSSNQQDTISNCRFIGNGIGALTEEWAENTISNCVFEGNTYGFWLGSGRNVVVSGCTIANSTNWGMSTDRTFSVTIGSNLYDLSIETQHENVVITGCNIHDNGEDGVIIAGLRGTSRIGESFIGNNGQDGLKASSGFSEILIDVETVGGGGAQQLVIGGNVFGNQKTTSITNGSQYGIRATSGAHGDLNIQANYFQDLNDPVSIAGSNITHVSDNLFIICVDNITVPSTATWINNRVRGGTMENGEWDDELVRTLSDSKTWDPPDSTASGGLETTTVTVTGAVAGDVVTCGHTAVTAAGWLLFGTVSSADTVTVTLYNGTGGVASVSSGTLRVRVYKH